MPTRIALELSDDDLEGLDEAVARGDFDSREAAVHAALLSLLGQPSETKIADAYRRAYADVSEDARWGNVGLRLATERLREIG